MSNSNLYISGQSNINIRDDYSCPTNKRINIRKKVYRANQYPNYYSKEGKEEFVDNYQYYERANIKNENKKYGSITHITGYSNLIPLNRMKNFDNIYKSNQLYEPKNYIKKVQKQKINNNSNNFCRYTERIKEEDYNQKIYQNDNYTDYEHYDSYENNQNDKLENNRRKIREHCFSQDYTNNQILKDDNRYKSKQIFKVKGNKYKYQTNIEQEINDYRRHNKSQERNNIKRTEIFYTNKKKSKKNRINSQTDNLINTKIKIDLNSYKRNNVSNYSKEQKNISTKTTKVTKSKDSKAKKITSYHQRIKTPSNNYISNLSYNYINNNNKYKRYKFRDNSNVQQKTAILNFQNPNIKVDTYGENFDVEKYKQEYINIKDVENGKIENHIQTSLSKDGQYLISVTSAKRIYDDKKNEVGEQIYELPEKNVEEIVSTIQTKKKNLGDNYKFYESKYLQMPNYNSYTTHRRRGGERTIYGKEQYETKEVKHYKIPPQYNNNTGFYYENYDNNEE
jgi:hypothetical protein